MVDLAHSPSIYIGAGHQLLPVLSAVAEVTLNKQGTKTALMFHFVYRASLL